VKRKLAPALVDGGEHVQEIARRAGEAVQACDQKHVSRLKPADHLGQLGTRRGTEPSGAYCLTQRSA
jgi:hypothetical protein